MRQDLSRGFWGFELRALLLSASVITHGATFPATYDLSFLNLTKTTFKFFESVNTRKAKGVIKKRNNEEALSGFSETNYEAEIMKTVSF